MPAGACPRAGGDPISLSLSLDLFSIIVKIVDLPVVDGGDEVDAQAEALAA